MDSICLAPLAPGFLIVLAEGSSWLRYEFPWIPPHQACFTMPVLLSTALIGRVSSTVSAFAGSGI